MGTAEIATLLARLLPNRATDVPVQVGGGDGGEQVGGKCDVERPSTYFLPLSGVIRRASLANFLFPRPDRQPLARPRTNRDVSAGHIGHDSAPFTCTMLGEREMKWSATTCARTVTVVATRHGRHRRASARHSNEMVKFH
nr:hypothetical protein CFP56_34962 [Quercus suber]